MQQAIVLFNSERILTYTYKREHYFQWNHMWICFIISITVAWFLKLYTRIYGQPDIVLNQKILI